jgi:Lrp/AsnC family transcriptional regulator for asnA, asnC and gidA|tara:strand:- start:38 stop:463 length:426 start_codon:yes stop_codon:yes gene_type:complete
MDNKDKKIIKILSKDSRTPYTVMAQKIKLSESSVRKRVMNLEKNGIIEKFTIIINPAKVGFNTVAIIGLDVDPSKFLEITSKMAKFKEVKYVATSTGDHMIMLEMWTKDGKELTEIISEKIGKIKGINRICPSIILEKYKL